MIPINQNINNIDVKSAKLINQPGIQKMPQIEVDNIIPEVMPIPQKINKVRYTKIQLEQIIKNGDDIIASQQTKVAKAKELLKLFE